MDASRTSQMKAISCILVLLALVGCGNKPAIPVFSVQGQVFFQGKAAAGALVVFHPDSTEENQPIPRGRAGKDGRFQLTTRSKDDGAPAGRYRVTIVWRDQKDEDEDSGPNRLPRQYGLPNLTPLRVTVKESDIKLEPFRIDSE